MRAQGKSAPTDLWPVRKSFLLPALLGASLGLSLFLHRDVLDRDLTGFHVWRQSLTMWNVRNFLRYDNCILNPRVAALGIESGVPIVSRYEFPLFQWTAAQLQRVWGEDIAVVRAYVFAIGAVGVIGFYLLLTALGLGQTAALIGALFWQCSPAFYYYTVNPLPDVLALTAGVWYLYFFFRYAADRRPTFLVGAAVALSLATLAKLPFLMFAVVGIVHGLRREPRRWRYAGVHLLALLPAIAWYAWVMPAWGGNGILRGVFDNQISWARAGELLWFHASELFPATLLGWAAVPLFLVGALHPRPRLLPLVGITLVYLLLQLNMIGENHDYYLLPLLPWLFVGVADGARRLLTARARLLRYLLLPLLLLAALDAHRSAQPKWSVAMAYFNPDVFTHQAALQRAVPPGSRVLLVNDKSHVIFAYLVDRQGLSFERDRLRADAMPEIMRRFRPAYLYSDSRRVEENIRPFLGPLMLEAGSVRVYPLVSGAAD